MVDNFRACEINRGARKLVQTPTLIIKKKQSYIETILTSKGLVREEKKRREKLEIVSLILSHTTKTLSLVLPRTHNNDLTKRLPKKYKKRKKTVLKKCLSLSVE
jgi:hypothetical protein